MRRLTSPRRLAVAAALIAGTAYLCSIVWTEMGFGYPSPVASTPNPSPAAKTAKKALVFPEPKSANEERICEAAKSLLASVNSLNSAKTKQEVADTDKKMKKCKADLIQGADASLPYIVVLLHDDRQMVQAKALSTLRPIGSAKAFDLLLQAAKDPESLVRTYALQEIEAFPQDKEVPREAIRKIAVPTFLELLRSEDKDIRAAAWRALWRIAQPPHIFKSDSSEQERASAIAKLKDWNARESGDK